MSKPAKRTKQVQPQDDPNLDDQTPTTDELIAQALVEKWEQSQQNPSHPKFSPTEQTSPQSQISDSFQKAYDNI